MPRWMPGCSARINRSCGWVAAGDSSGRGSSQARVALDECRVSDAPRARPEERGRRRSVSDLRFLKPGPRVVRSCALRVRPCADGRGLLSVQCTFIARCRAAQAFWGPTGAPSLCCMAWLFSTTQPVEPVARAMSLTGPCSQTRCHAHPLCLSADKRCSDLLLPQLTPVRLNMRIYMAHGSSGGASIFCVFAASMRRISDSVRHW